MPDHFDRWLNAKPIALYASKQEVYNPESLQLPALNLNEKLDLPDAT